MKPEAIIIRTEQVKNHIAGLRSWLRQDAVALAQTLKEQRVLIDQVIKLEAAIAAAEMELEILKGAKI